MEQYPEQLHQRVEPQLQQWQQQHEQQQQGVWVYASLPQDTSAFTFFIMALYTELPVFKRTYDLLIELIRTALALQRAYKYTFGERLQQEALELLLDIYKANTVTNKFAYISSARGHLEVVRLLLRALCDLKQITQKRFLFLNTIVEDISKQLAGWQKSGKAEN